ncbi:MAG: capsular polysaccharide biosynthesis protein, partial [Deltaproteobacteria bacterium]
MSPGSDGLATPLDKVGVLSRGLIRLQGLETFLGARRIVTRPGARQAQELSAVAGWGHKPTADRARAFARRHQLPYLALEDGFLRSVGLGADEPPLSLVVDDLGIYYDARAPSRLESILAGDGAVDQLANENLLGRARRCRERIVEAKLSKYNHTPVELPASWHRGDRPVVLVVDQTFGDASVTQGMAGPGTFDRMLSAARDEHPHARIVVKVHPVTSSGAKRGYLAARPKQPGVEYLPDPVNPVALLQQVDHVYVCTSQFGFEALMVGKPVNCFGAPFYAGWGLTHDQIRLPRRNRSRSLDELVAAALLLYPRYRHPISGKACDAEEVIEHLALQRRMFADNARSFHCLGFSTWKHPFVRRYLSSPGGQVRFVRSWRKLSRDLPPDGATVVLWGSGRAARRLVSQSGNDVPVWRMEDGFLRSVRLGSELTPPGSLVLDRRGLYYDPAVPSDLETLLQEATFTATELERAARLREQIVDSKVSKYNVSMGSSFRPKAKADQTVVLVPGQVTDDASVRLGSPQVRDDGALLQAVRQLCPDSYVVYKPHPDVLSGNRRGQ